MRRTLILLTLVLAAAGTLYGQGPAKFDFKTLDLQAGAGEFDVSGRIHKLSGGADVVLTPSDPATPPLRVRAKTMEFTYGEEGTMPSRIVLTGSVVIDHPKGTVTAGKADWSLDQNTMVFTDSPQFKSADPVMGIRGERIEFNLASGAVNVDRPVMKDVQFQQSAAPSAPAAAPGLLSTNDISDWPGFLGALKAAAGNETPSPGKRILSLLDEHHRRFFETSTVDQLAGNKDTVLKQINRVLQNRNLYDAQAWAGIALPAKASALLNKDSASLTDAEVIELNRRLIDAAFQEMISPLA